MWSKVIVFMAVSCLIWANMAQAYPQGKGQGNGSCGPPPSGPPPSGPPPSGMPPPNGQGGPCGPPPNGVPPSGAPPAATTPASSG
ncbi:proline, histidine and glycine-rich protein 1 [Lucilia cuprina]|uniref:proline, histidine and glycine-rich protein 1 n=1 Tax=Lucilia cuprina TaxID=7375 RepID=UPI001F05BD4A|nr:proline, histidine and glycine-rich protein 1 [Lucilia cuprina]